MSMMKEFKEFAMKGNLVDMAVAFVMGAAFTKVTSSFINGMVMPLVGQLTGGGDLQHARTNTPTLLDFAERVDENGAVSAVGVEQRKLPKPQGIQRFDLRQDEAAQCLGAQRDGAGKIEVLIAFPQGERWTKPNGVIRRQTSMQSDARRFADE